MQACYGHTTKSKGSAFLWFEQQRHAVMAIIAMHGQLMLPRRNAAAARPLTVRPALHVHKLAEPPRLPPPPLPQLPLPAPLFPSPPFRPAAGYGRGMPFPYAQQAPLYAAAAQPPAQGWPPPPPQPGHGLQQELDKLAQHLEASLRMPGAPAPRPSAEGGFHPSELHPAAVHPAAMLFGGVAPMLPLPRYPARRGAGAGEDTLAAAPPPWPPPPAGPFPRRMEDTSAAALPSEWRSAMPGDPAAAPAAAGHTSPRGHAAAAVEQLTAQQQEQQRRLYMSDTGASSGKSSWTAAGSATRPDATGGGSEAAADSRPPPY